VRSTWQRGSAGDEFALVMPQTDRTGARRRRGKRFQHHLVRRPRAGRPDVAVSVGIAQWDEGDDPRTASPAAADAQLYEAKRTRRRGCRQAGVTMQLPPRQTPTPPTRRSALSLPAGWVRDVLEWAEPQLLRVGALAPRELLRWGEEMRAPAPPGLRTIEPWGERVDEVVYPDAWRNLAAAAATTGCTGLPYEEEAIAIAGPQVRVVHAALGYPLPAPDRHLLLPGGDDRRRRPGPDRVRP